MGRFASAFDFRSIENPATKLSDPAQWLVDAFTGGPVDSGVVVSQESATRMTAFWCAVRILSETIAALPVFVYQRMKPRGRRKAAEHPLFDVLHLAPNGDMSSFFFRELLQAQVVINGNGYAAIRRDAAGAAKELWPLTTQRVEPRRDLRTLELVYLIRLNDGTVEEWKSQDMLHVAGLSFDGLKGRSVIGAAREAIGLGLAAQKYGAKMFSRGGRVPGVIETQFAKLAQDQRKNLEESWAASVGGPDNWHKVAVLDRGMTYKQIGVPPEDVQFMDLRKFQVVEMARVFRVPPHKLFDLERATFTNIEHQSLEFVTDTILPWAVRWEMELNRKLLTPAERAQGYFIAFNLDGLLRGDTASRGSFYAQGRQWGWFTTNDILDLENMPDAGPAGDVRLVPINMVNAEDLVPGAGGAPAPAPAPPGAREVRRLAAYGTRGLGLRRRIRAAQRPLLEDRAAIIVSREIGAVEKEIKRTLRARRSLADFKRALETFYAEHALWAGQKMHPVLAGYAELIDAAMADELRGDPGAAVPPQLEMFAGHYARRFGAREASEGRQQLLAIAAAGDDEQAIASDAQARLDEWGQKRAGKIGLNESVQFMSAAAKVLYALAGVTVLRWAANATACPFCLSLDGKVAGIEQNFVAAGEGVDAGADAGPPLKPSDNIGHPPLHNGCECDVVAD